MVPPKPPTASGYIQYQIYQRCSPDLPTNYESCFDDFFYRLGRLSQKSNKFKILQFTNSKCCIKAREPSKTLFNGAVPLIYFKNILSIAFFILKTFCSTLNSWIGEFVISIFGVTNRLNRIVLTRKNNNKKMNSWDLSNYSNFFRCLVSIHQQYEWHGVMSHLPF